VNHRRDQNVIRFQAINDPILVDDEFANILIVELRDLTVGCPILARSVRKGGIPPLRAPWDSFRSLERIIGPIPDSSRSPAPLLLLSRKSRRQFVTLNRRISPPHPLQNTGDLGRIGPTRSLRKELETSGMSVKIVLTYRRWQETILLGSHFGK